MIDLQTVLTYLTLVSIPVGVAYHIMTLNNTRKNQQLQLETRQVQMFQYYIEKLSSPEIITASREIQKWEWKDSEDFINKYWYPDNPEKAESLRICFALYERIGILLKEGVIDLPMLYDMIGGIPIREWERFESVIDYIRVNYEEGVKGMLFEYFEDLVYALMEHREIDRKNFVQRYQRRKQTRAKYGKTIPEFNP
jgi:hypothetical protein